VTADLLVTLGLLGLAVVCAVLVVVLLRFRAGARRSDAELVALRERLDELEHTLAAETRPGEGPQPAEPDVEFLITDLGREQTPTEPVRIDGPAFADIVVKETVVKAASLAHGLRRGLAPANRNRIRFEMKQEVRRARKQRRADLKAAQRDLHARQRRSLAEEAS
jgi:hypothetical protein